MNLLLRKTVAILTVASMMIISVGCSNGGQNNSSNEKNAQIANEQGYFAIMDQAGNEVMLPNKIERVVISSIAPLPSIYCLFRGSAEGLVGMSPVSMSAAENSFLPNVVPDVLDVNTSFIKGSEINIEELIKVDPDVVFYSANNTEEYALLTNAGIPAVGFSTSNDGFNTIDTLNSWLLQLGEIFKEENRAAGIVEQGEKTLELVQERVKDLDNQDKPKVLILFHYGNGTMKTSGSNFFGEFWIEETGGINVASELNGTPEISMEQIYQWNPDKIFITNFSSYLPEDLFNNTIEGHDWSKVKAVQEGEVYKFPLGMYRWFPPSSDTPLSLLWVAKHIQPELFNDLDLDQEIKTYYKTYYNMSLTDQDVEGIYHPAREAAER